MKTWLKLNTKKPGWVFYFAHGRSTSKTVAREINGLSCQLSSSTPVGDLRGNDGPIRALKMLS